MASLAHPFALPWRDAVSRYRHARRLLATPGSRRSRIALDWMNFFVADVQTGFGAFVAFYLAGLGWSKTSVGLALGIGGVTGVLAQVPGGAIADALSWKRALAALGIAMIGTAALILALAPNQIMVFVAETLQGMTAGIILPAIAGISLGLVGRRAMSSRTGRNFRFSAAGNALTAAVMGLAAAYFSPSAIFLIAAAFCVPALIAVYFIDPNEIDYARARNAATGKQAGNILRAVDLLKNRKLLLFTGSVVLFQLADASMLPLVGQDVATGDGGSKSLVMSGLIIIPQIVVAILAPWVGYHSEAKGRRPLLLLGFAVEPVRAGLLAFSTSYPILIVAQIINGISGAIITVLTVLVITDLTTGTGRFNLTNGTVGMMSGIAAAASTILTGFIAQQFGREIGFIAIAVIAAAATGLLWVFLSETKPAKYVD
jgi:MFS family permease